MSICSSHCGSKGTLIRSNQAGDDPQAIKWNSGQDDDHQDTPQPVPF